MDKKKISAKEIEKISLLARIALTNKEKEKFTQEIASILDFVNDLAEVDIQDFTPLDHYATGHNQFRTDDVSQTPEDEREATRKLFPKRRGDFLEVKTVIKS